MKSRQSLNNAFDNWMSFGIFHYLNALSVPWSDEELKTQLDTVYHGNHSGEKLISPLVSKLLGEDDSLTIADKEKLAESILLIYGKQWSKLWDTLSFDYNPIENYNMVENGSNGNTETRNLTTTNTGTVGTVSDGTTKVNAFNSTEAVDSNASEDSSTTTNNLTSGDTGTVGNVGSHQLTRSGNIGVTTSQQMIQSERDLWVWSFFEQVFADLDKILTLQIY